MYLMSKNIVLAEFDFDKMVFNVIKPDLMPFALRGIGVNLFTLRDWLTDRVLSLSRSNAKVILGSLGLNQNDKLGICYSCRGLSLIDCYWVKDTKDTITWEQVKLYNNSLSKAVANVALTGKYISIQGRIRTPELTGDGSYAKCWRRGKDGTYLYKAGSLQGNGKEHLIEVFCSDLLDNLDVSHVKYTLTKSCLMNVSRCKNITDEQISICDMNYFIGYCNRNNIDIKKYLYSQPDFYKMLIVDYLIFNSDRHAGNWGVFFNADTGSVIGLHPLFDHNLCLDPNGSYMSKVIPNKTLEECAKMAKKHVKLDTNKLNKWLRLSSTKKRLKEIDKTGYWYKALVNRVRLYNSW